MIKITKEQFDVLKEYVNSTADIGYICEWGAIVGDARWVLKEDNNQYFLAHISDFIQNGIIIKEKE